MEFRSPYSHGFVRCAVCTPACEVADPEFNAKAIFELSRQGHDHHVALMVFPELCLPGYAIDDLLGQNILLDAVEASIGAVLTASADLDPVLLIRAPLRREGRLFNCALAVHGGKILGVVPKAHLPNYREFYEKRWFASGRIIRDAEITVAGRSRITGRIGKNERMTGAQDCNELFPKQF